MAYHTNTSEEDYIDMKNGTSSVETSSENHSGSYEYTDNSGMIRTDSGDVDVLSTNRSHTQARYSDDFEAESTRRSNTQNRYSDDFEPLSTQRSHTQTRYSDDFEAASTQKSPTHFRYSDDFEAASTQKSDLQTAYSDDFEPPSTKRSHTQNEDSGDFEAVSRPLGQTSIRYSDDFEVPSTQRGEISSRLSDNCDMASSKSPIARPRTMTSSSSLRSRETTCHDTGQTSTNESTCDDDSTVSNISSSSEKMSEKTNSSASDLSKRYSSSIQLENKALSEEAIDARNNFIERQLRLLKVLKTTMPAETSLELLEEPSVEPTADVPVESDPHSAFCRKKIELVRQRKGKEAENGSTVTHASRLYKGLSGSTPVISCGISERQTNWLRLKNLMQKMKQASSEEIHEPRKCPSCRAKMAVLARHEFIAAKTAQLSETMIERKFDEHCYRYTDPIKGFGEIFSASPTLHDNPEIVTNRLMKPLQHARTPHMTSDATWCLAELSNLSGNTQEFWDFYLSPLENCSWMPKRTSSENNKN